MTALLYSHKTGPDLANVLVQSDGPDRLEEACLEVGQQKTEIQPLQPHSFLGNAAVVASTDTA